MRRSPRASKKVSPEQEPARRAAEDLTTRKKRVKREDLPDKPSTASSSPDAPASATAETVPTGDAGTTAAQPSRENGPSAYELARLEKIKKNAMVMASLGLATGAAGGMRAAVKTDAVKRSRARGISSRQQPKPNLVRTRESARVRGKTPEGLPMEDPEEVFNRYKVRKWYVAGDGAGVQETAGADDKYRSRLVGDVSMDASNASTDDTRRLRKIMGGLESRYGADGDAEGCELAEPDELLTRLRGLAVGEAGVCKVVEDRAYSLAWHPSKSKLLLAAGDKVGNIGLWTVDAGESNHDKSGASEEDGGVFQFKPHTGSVARLTFDPLDGNKLVSTSYDGTVRRMDVEKGAFDEVFANNENDDAFLTDGHLMAEERLVLLSDSVGDITAVDLRTSKQVWKREAHEKKANTVHTHPNARHLFVTASLDRSVKLWDARNLGAGTAGGSAGGVMKPVAEMAHFRSVNSAHFSPSGEWMVTVGQDDKLRLYRDLALASGPKEIPYQFLTHNNQTGRWITKFQASWDPKSRSLFAVGSMQKNPHGIHLYSVDGAKDKKPSAVEIRGGDFMASIQSIVAFHPSKDVLAGANSSGRVHVFQ